LVFAAATTHPRSTRGAGNQLPMSTDLAVTGRIAASDDQQA
jgi:hypothetical protein